MVTHTHQLNIIIVDEKENIVENDSLLKTVIFELVNKPLVKVGYMFNQNFDIHIQWETPSDPSIVNLANVQHKNVGVLFTNAYFSDKVLHGTTNMALDEIETLKVKPLNKDWKIMFHISKLLEMDNHRLIVR